VDGSIQPYAVAVPEGLDTSKPARLDLVLHGRGATLNEVSFITNQENPNNVLINQDRIEMHVFGRTNNAYRWSGETDVFEALASVERLYKIDPARIVLRGFSMGGAGAWHIGLHHPSRWAAVEAGAGFTETITYAKQTNLPEYQSRPLRIYDAVEYSANAFNVPIVGYGGEIDPQLQASVNIRERLTKEAITGLRALFLVGPKTPHKWHPDSKKDSDAFLDSHIAQPAPRDEIRFTTYTARYNNCGWISIDALDRHYDRAQLDASRSGGAITVRTANIARLTVHGRGTVTIDGQKAGASGTFEKINGRWRKAEPLRGLRKIHGLQGPIDDAFMDSFLLVSGSSLPGRDRLNRAGHDFAKWLRGDPRVKHHDEITGNDIANHHLVLFGDPASNPLIGRITPKLPIEWNGTTIRAGAQAFDAATHTLVMIYPNPLNPKKYVVLNTGHSFSEREFKGTNALLFPRYGDWAILDEAGKPVAAGLFDEQWRLPVAKRQ
jgi:dienelactone hydrolase